MQAGQDVAGLACRADAHADLVSRWNGPTGLASPVGLVSSGAEHAGRAFLVGERAGHDLRDRVVAQQASTGSAVSLSESFEGEPLQGEPRGGEPVADRTLSHEMFADGAFAAEAFAAEALAAEAFAERAFADGAFADGASAAWASAEGPDWPPSALPVALWPVETLRLALSDAPGAQLARVVSEVMDRATELDPDLPAELPDDALADLATACGRLQSWAAGLQARVVAERAARETSPLAHSSLVGQVTGELVVTEAEASEVVVRAEAGSQHPTVVAALVAGRIDVRKAHTLLRSAAQLTVDERAEAITRFLPQAPRRTWKWLQTRMLAFAKARHGAAETAKAAAERRCVQLDRAENDMGWLAAYLPAVDAAAVWGVVDDMAHQLRRTPGEERTLGQLRADSLTGIVTGRLLPGDRFADADADVDADADAEQPRAADAQDGVDAGNLVDAPEGFDVSGTGRVPDVTDGVDGPGAPVCTCGGRAPVVRHLVQSTVQPVRVTPTRPVVRVTVPASVLLGADDAPGDLAGFGPIPAETARLIAQDATWQRLVTDPVTGILTDHSTTTYQPGKVLRAAVQARDETCVFMTCDAPAVWDDLDHIVPFDHDSGHTTPSPGVRGQTRAENLQPLCRKHHLLKTHAGWGVVRDPATGVTTWTAPTGRTYARPPTVLDTHVELDRIDAGTSHDLTLRALAGRRLPPGYRSVGPGEPLGGAAGTPDRLTGSGDPPF